MGRPAGVPHPRTDEDAAFVKKLRVPVHELDYARFTGAANRAGLTFAEFARRALHEATLVLDTFYYVRLPNGDTHPSRSEKGYEFFDNARRFAARCSGQVIRAAIDHQDGTAQGPRPDREGLGARP